MQNINTEKILENVPAINVKEENGQQLVSARELHKGLMEVKERTVNNPDGSIRVTITTKVTGKGQRYFVNKFLGN